MEPSTIHVLHFLYKFECEGNRLVRFTFMAIIDSDSVDFTISPVLSIQFWRSNFDTSPFSATKREQNVYKKKKKEVRRALRTTRRRIGLFVLIFALSSLRAGKLYRNLYGLRALLEEKIFPQIINFYGLWVFFLKEAQIVKKRKTHRP